MMNKSNQTKQRRARGSFAFALVSTLPIVVSNIVPGKRKRVRTNNQSQRPNNCHRIIVQRETHDPRRTAGEQKERKGRQRR